MVTVQVPKRRSVVSVLASHRPGSGDWSWAEEAADLLRRDRAALRALAADIRRHGVREPVLLGDDGRVWDGHHRIVAALLSGTSHLAVVSGTGGRN